MRRSLVTIITLLLAAIASVQSVHAAVSEYSADVKQTNTRKSAGVEFSASNQRVGGQLPRLRLVVAEGLSYLGLIDASWVTNVFDSNCVSLERTGSQIGNTVQVRFNAPAAGTYFIAINFSAQSLFGQPAPSPETTVHYDFMTTGVPDSTSGLGLVKHFER